VLDYSLFLIVRFFDEEGIIFDGLGKPFSRRTRFLREERSCEMRCEEYDEKVLYDCSPRKHRYGLAALFSQSVVQFGGGYQLALASDLLMLETGHPALWMHLLQPGSMTGTAVRQRGHRSKNGLSMML
jgi:hypothetical protein